MMTGCQHGASSRAFKENWHTCTAQGGGRPRGSRVDADRHSAGADGVAGTDQKAPVMPFPGHLATRDEWDEWPTAHLFVGGRVVWADGHQADLLDHVQGGQRYPGRRP